MTTTPAERLKTARESLGLTQQALADRCEPSNITQSRVSDWESGRRRMPDAATLAAVAATLGVTLNWLMALSDDGGPVEAEPAA